MPVKSNLLRWTICLAAIVLQWVLFVDIAQWYITAFVTPRTGLYWTNPLTVLLVLGPPASLVLIAAGYFIADWRAGIGRALLALWALAGLFFTVRAAIDEFSAGREFLPDVICYVWFFVFHPSVVFAMLTTRSWSPNLRSA